jgi:hypothetical protein
LRKKLPPPAGEKRKRGPKRNDESCGFASGLVAALLLKFGDGHDLAAHRIRALPSGQQLLGWCTELKETCTRVAQLVEAVHTFEENL